MLALTRCGFLTLAARLLVREVPLERCVLVPHAPELAFFAVRGRRRGRPELRREALDVAQDLLEDVPGPAGGGQRSVHGDDAAR